MGGLPQSVIEDFYKEDSASRARAFAAATELGAGAIAQLAQLLDDPAVTAESASRRVLFDIAARSSAPGAPASQRAALIRELQNALKDKRPEKATAYLQWLAGMLNAL